MAAVAAFCAALISPPAVKYAGRGPDGRELAGLQGHAT
jgi:hypothetical protein